MNCFIGNAGFRLSIILVACLSFLVATQFLSNIAHATVIINGTPEQRNKIARWLSLSLGTNVTIDNNGSVSVGAGGNRAATRLRNMATDPNTTATINVVSNQSNVFLGRWNNGVGGRSNGTQTVDIADLEGIGNVINFYGLTPDVVLIHEITEVYEAVKHNLTYDQAHQRAIDAERELMDSHNTSFVNPRGWLSGGYLYLKIRLGNGTHCVVRANASEPTINLQWFREVVPCNTTSGLIAVADPDPQVHILQYDPNGNHTPIASWDTENSYPTGVAYDAQGYLYVCEDLAENDEIRIFDRQGLPVGTISLPEMTNPRGICVDGVTGDIFVACHDSVIRYDRDLTYLGSYTVADAIGFKPTDVAVWRSYPWSVWNDATQAYNIYVSDRASSQVYCFDVDLDLNLGSYRFAFGSTYLSGPEGLAIDSWEQIWVASTANGRLVRFNPAGELLPSETGDFFVEDTDKLFYDVEMLDGDGIYAVDGTPDEGSLLLYSYDGSLLNTYASEIMQCPESIAIQFSVNTSNLIPSDWESNFTAPTDHPIVDLSSFAGGLYAAAGNVLYVYDGTGWNVLDSPAFTVSLYTHGDFLIVGAQSGLYVFDGLSFSLVFEVPTYVRVLGAYNGVLYAGSMLDVHPKLYYCNGSAGNPADWHVDTEFSEILIFSAPCASIDSLAVYDDLMYVGAGGNLYSFDGNDWSIIGAFDDVYAFLDMEVYNGNLYLATRDHAWLKPKAGGNSGFSGRVIRFNGTGWETVLEHDYWCFCLKACDYKLYLGTANGIYTCDGFNWNLSLYAADNAFYALSFEIYDDKVYAGMGNGYLFVDPVQTKANVEIVAVAELPYSHVMLLFLMNLLTIAVYRQRARKS